ncbi:hypothetical protein RRG08_052683 [Elysia crispata]|uniref:Uncharacterized protein n=1 Tax=Elysia crispata TaxID=231223 RepID=A0AAE1EB36_9GAST|nr:hypothetical protein RRG08_052683 [Elysia crispata]
MIWSSISISYYFVLLPWMNESTWQCHIGGATIRHKSVADCEILRWSSELPGVFIYPCVSVCTHLHASDVRNLTTLAACFFDAEDGTKCSSSVEREESILISAGPTHWARLAHRDRLRISRQ